MKAKTKLTKLWSFLLSLVMLLSLLPTTAEAYLPTPNPNTPHSNNGWVELNGPLGVAALKEYLKDENNTWYMRLTGNISLDDDSFEGITVKGTKYLDLNGYSVDVNRDGGKELTLFEVPEGSTIVVCDSRGGGRIHYDGYLDMDQSCNSEGGQVKFRAIRNLFHVEGTMILNGGELDGGRSKQVWVTYSHAAGSADYYTGYVRQQLYATGIDVDGGTLIMNGGSVCGRGDYRDAIYAWNSGTVVINGGRILGLGGANALRCRDYQPPSVSIRGGYFETRKIDKEHCGRYPGAAHSSPHYVYVYGYQFLGYSPGELRATYYIVSDRQPAYNTATVTLAAPVTGEKAAVASDAIVTGVTRTGESEEIVNHGVYVRRLTWFIDANGNGQLDENEECTPENGLTADGRFLGGKTYSVYFELAVTEGMGRLNNEAFTLKVNDLEVPINTTAAQGVYTFPETEIVGYGVSGNVESFNSGTDPVTIQLIEQGASEAAYEVQVSGGTQSGNKFTAPYAFSDVPTGTYTMKVMKKNHVTREYTVTVGSSNVTQDVEIWLLGDVNGDGTINVKDKKLIFNHLNDPSGALTGYALDVGDVNRDGTINVKDKKLIFNHLKGTSLWS